MPQGGAVHVAQLEQYPSSRSWGLWLVMPHLGHVKLSLKKLHLQVVHRFWQKEQEHA